MVRSSQMDELAQNPCTRTTGALACAAPWRANSKRERRATHPVALDRNAVRMFRLVRNKAPLGSAPPRWFRPLGHDSSGRPVSIVAKARETLQLRLAEPSILGFVTCGDRYDHLW